MIIRGILDRSLNGVVCIRGYARLEDLAQISKPRDYQRNIDEVHKDEIVDFINKRQYLFFPEIVLSYSVDPEVDNIILSPFEKISIVKNPKASIAFSKTTKTFKNEVDSRNENKIEMVTINIKDLFISNNKVFSRIDGNHRLTASVEISDKNIQNYSTPFCIILLNNQIENIKFESAVFHNINSKGKNLTSEENLKVILQKDVFNEEELKDNFGWELYAVREIFENLPNNLEQVYPNLSADFLSQPRTITKQIIELLLENKIIGKSKVGITSINTALKDINQLFGTYPKLKDLKSIAFTVAAVYLHLSKQNNVDLFINWLLKNHINEIEGLTSKSLISIYQKIRETKSKQIFVSMQFDEDTRSHHDAIKKAVAEINQQFNFDIKLREIRIDMFNRGHSYKIDDEILFLIEESGLLIADLSSGNKNVYQELGYLMGLNQGKGLKQENFILIKKQDKESKETDIGFNIRPFQQLRFKSDLDLINMLKSSIVEYYDLA